MLAADGRNSLVVELAEVLLRVLAELLALMRISLCSLNPSLLCCDDVDSLEVGGESFFFWLPAAPLAAAALDAATVACCCWLFVFSFSPAADVAAAAGCCSFSFSCCSLRCCATWA